MTNNENKGTQDQRIEEMKKLVEESKHVSEGKQLPLLFPEELGGEDIGFDANLLQDTADPEKSYRLYYAIQRILKDNLPSGRKNKKLRQFVYDEKNLFLNQGKGLDERGIRGSDGRMTFISTFLEPAFNTVGDWVKSGGSAFDLFMAFYGLNEDHGFHEKKEEKTTFDDTLKAVLSVPPPRKNKEEDK